MQNKSISIVSFILNTCKVQEHYFSALLKCNSLCSELQSIAMHGLHGTFLDRKVRQSFLKLKGRSDEQSVIAAKLINSLMLGNFMGRCHFLSYIGRKF